jgi:hypothetical protein
MTRFTPRGDTKFQHSFLLLLNDIESIGMKRRGYET